MSHAAAGTRSLRRRFRQNVRAKQRQVGCWPIYLPSTRPLLLDCSVIWGSRMQKHFPCRLEARDDEVFYSIVNRVSRRRVYPSSRAFAHALLGDEKVTKAFFRRAPWGVKELADVLASTPAALYQKHTLLPFWEWGARLALPADDWAMRLQGKDALERRYHYSQLWAGEAAPRFCIHCVAADIVTYGEPHYRRRHQLPGVLVCTEHHDWLVNRCDRCGWESSRSRLEYPPIRCACGKRFFPRRPKFAASLVVESEYAKWCSELLEYELGSRKFPRRHVLRELAAYSGIQTWTKRDEPRMEEADKLARSRKSKVLRGWGRFVRRVSLANTVHVLEPVLEVDEGQQTHPVELLLGLKALMGDINVVDAVLSSERRLMAASIWQQRWNLLPGQATEERVALLSELLTKRAPDLKATSISELDRKLAAELGITRAAVLRYRVLSAQLNRKFRTLRPDLYS